jgi:hypothetical protein
MNDMTTTVISAREQALFHLTGRHREAGAAAIDGLGLRPALFARFHDLTRLRYDFPLVLNGQGGEKDCLRSLSDIVDDLLYGLDAEGAAGERLRRSVLRLEREVRVLLAAGAMGTLGDLWDEATARLVERGGEGAREDLRRARAALRASGTVVDCDPAMPALLVTHVWRTVQQAKARAMRADIDALIVRLADLLKADHLRSGDGRSAEMLASGIGVRHRDLFDFDAMARFLARPSGASGLSEARRRRIDSVLGTLGTQQFFVSGGGFGFEFGDAAEAVAAYRRRLPELAQLVRAMTIGELEANGRYHPAQHDAVFADWGPDSLRRQDLARFPDYLVCEAAEREARPGAQARRRALALEALATGAPVKILVDSGALLDDARPGEPSPSVGAQLAFSATAFDGVYVLQTSASHLYRVRDKLMGAMRHHGPALVSVYSGAHEGRTVARGGTPPYLMCAAATEARVFPVFCYDPGAGTDWAARFTLEGNPQPDADWPQHELVWADAHLQRNVATLRFTLADFAAGDARFARHFASAASEKDDGRLVQVAQWLAQAPSDEPDRLPFVYAIDADNHLRKLVVDDALMQATRLCAEAWHRLRELDDLKRKTAPVAPATTVDAPAGAASASAQTEEKVAPAAAAPAAEPSAETRVPGAPYIETERCSSCNECTTLNNVLFAYNENKQAYIANPDAGTYRELVEAAESCQVAVIHPGNPRNSKEPGLEELMRRAEPFQ